MNIPVVPVGEVQQLPAGSTQAVIAGSIAVTPHDEFAVTFGATLRQSEQQANASLQKCAARELQNGNPAGGDGAHTGAGVGTSGLETDGLRILQGAGRVSETDKQAALDSDSAIERQTGDAGEIDAKSSVQSLPAGLVESGTPAKLLSKTPDIRDTETVPQSRIPTEGATKGTVAGPAGVAGLNRTAISVKSSAVQETSSRITLTSNASLGVIAGSDTTQQSLTGLLAREISLFENGAVVDVTLPNHQAIPGELKDVLATGIKAPPGVAPLPEAPARTVAGKSTVATGTISKTPSARSAAKAGSESALTGVLDAGKTIAPELSTASLNGSMLAGAAIPVAFTAPENVAASPGGAAIDRAATKPIRESTGPSPASFNTASAQGRSGETRANVGQAIPTDSSEAVAVAIGNTSFEAALQGAAPAGSTIRAASTAATESGQPTSLPVQLSTSRLSPGRADRTTESLQTATPSAASTPVATLDARQQSTFDLTLKTGPQTATNSQGVPPGHDSPQPAEQPASTPHKPAAEQPVAAQGPRGTDAAKAVTDRPVAQGTPERVKQPVGDSASSPSSPSAQSETGASAGTAASANGHAPDKTSSIVIEPVFTIQPGSGVQASAIVIPHVAPGAAGPAVLDSPGSVVSSLESGRHAASAATLSAEPYRTISATPTALEVGVPNGTQGWLRIRAEVGDQGVVNASLAAGSNAGQELLHRQLPALNAYLHSEQIPVTTSVADRVFAAAGGNLAGMAAGSNGAPPDTSGRSTHQDLTAQGALTMSSGNHGGGAPGNSGQRDPVSTVEVVHGRDSAPGYDRRTGVSDTAVSRTSRDGESGRWLNVRA